MNEQVDSSKFKCKYAPSQGELEISAWVIRANLTEQGGFLQEKTETNSMWLHNVYSQALLEYEQNKIILSL